MNSTGDQTYIYIYTYIYILRLLTLHGIWNNNVIFQLIINTTVMFVKNKADVDGSYEKS